MFSFLFVIPVSEATLIPGFPNISEDMLQISLETEDFRETCRAINIKSGDYNLIGVLHLPTTTMPKNGYPTVVLFHGFRGNKLGGIQKLYRKLARELAYNGIACVRVDMAGCGDSEGCSNSVPIKLYLENGKDIFLTIKHYPEVDSNRLGAAGFSLGCHTAISLSKVYNPKDFVLKSLSLWAPIADGGILLKELYTQFNTNKDSASCVGKDFGLGPLPLVVCPCDIDDILCLQDHIVVNSIPYPKMRILHQQGEDDNIVSLTQQRLFKQMAPGGMTFQTYCNTGHSLENSPHSDTIIQKIVTHFLKTL
nr:alpha/beta hydrolase [Chlamydia sp. 17-3921]